MLPIKKNIYLAYNIIETLHHLYQVMAMVVLYITHHSPVHIRALLEIFNQRSLKE